MKKVFWWILGLLVSPVLLFVILAFLLYLPPVQNWAVQQVASIASEKTGMQITVGYVRLSFPLDLSINEVQVIHQPDTIAFVESLITDVQFMPLLDKRVVVNSLEVLNTRINTNGFVDAAVVKGNFHRLFVASRGIDLDKQTVEINGTTLENAHIDVALRDSVPEDTTHSETLWKIYADSIVVSHSQLVLHMPGDTMSVRADMGALIAREANIDLGVQIYTVASVDWTDGTLQYDQNFQPRIGGLDYNHIALSDVRVGIDSIYFHDPSLRLFVRQVALKEQSGLAITQITGPVIMEEGNLRLPNFQLQTPTSNLALKMTFPMSFTDSVSPGKMHLWLDTQLSRQDLLPFMAALPKPVQDRWPQYPLHVTGQVKGNLDYMEFNDLDVSLPTAFAAKASGFAANLNTPSQIRADVRFNAQTQNLGFFMASMPHDVQRNYRLPSLSVDGHFKADGPQYFTDLTALEGGGQLSIKGGFNADALRYNAEVKVDRLNLHHFMPRDSIYTTSFSLTASGQGTDFLSPYTVLTANGHIDQLNYGRWNINNVALEAEVKQGHAVTRIDSRNNLLNGIVTIDALLNRQRLDGSVIADVRQVDLYRLGFVQDSLVVGLCGNVELASDLKSSHTVTGIFNDLVLRGPTKTYRPADIGLLLKTRPDTTYVRAQSGDFIVKLDASGDYKYLLRKFEILTDTVMAKLDQKVIDQAAIRRLLPNMKFHVESKRDNPLATLLKTGQGIDFKDLQLDITSSPVNGLNGNGYVHSLSTGDMKIDTINFRLTHRERYLSFGGQVCNNKKNPQFVFNALFDGVFQEHGATLGVRLYDAKKRLGLRMGAKAEMVDSGISVHFLPEQPTIGYKVFNLNKDNFIFFGKNSKVKAKMDLIAEDGTGLKMYSEETNPSDLQDITISINKLNLGDVTSVFPYYLPQMTGLLNGDFHVVQDAAGHISVASDMQTRQLTYEKSPLGNLATELVYLQGEDDTHAIEGRLMKDDDEIALVTGTYYHNGEGSLDAKCQLERLPLSLVNGFIPDRLFGLQGVGEGELTIKGKVSEPQVNGEIYLDSSYLESIPYGVTLRFDNDPVRIVNSQLLFENFTVYAFNNNPLNIQGYFDFSHLDRMKVDMRMRARDYQIIGAEENDESIAFGKAFVNIYATMRGPVDKITMRGRLDVLGSTDMSYILRDSPLSTDNQLNELVKFVDFADTAKVVVQRPVPNGFSMDMTVDVSKGAHIMAYLNTDHSNYIDLVGGGTLRMQYDAVEQLQLRGRYTLSNGEMKYSMPVIPLKTFVIQDGSYIEFTGEPMNPTLNITATEHTKATVSNADGVGRSVDFNCGVKITRTLNDMGLEFLLDAPEDMQIHGELMAMGAEQRGKLAVTMLTTGMYLNSGGTGVFTMNSALSSFLSNEINSITGNAMRTLDMSFGMDNSTDASGQSHTDYSFKFAKRFMNNRLKIAVGGVVSSGANYQQRNNSFFDNVSLEYRLDQTANKFVTLYFQNNSYDWLDGYTQKYGGGFTWRRSLSSFWDIFRFKDSKQPVPKLPNKNMLKTTQMNLPKDSLKTSANEEK